MFLKGFKKLSLDECYLGKTYNELKSFSMDATNNVISGYNVIKPVITSFAGGDMSKMKVS